MACFPCGSRCGRCTGRRGRGRCGPSRLVHTPRVGIGRAHRERACHLDPTSLLDRDSAHLVGDLGQVLILAEENRDIECALAGEADDVGMASPVCREAGTQLPSESRTPAEARRLNQRGVDIEAVLSGTWSVNCILPRHRPSSGNPGAVGYARWPRRALRSLHSRIGSAPSLRMSM
jgi:hypothetical protein